MAISNGGSGDLVITRVLDAPRDRVFRAWTDPEQLLHWWGPKGFTWVSGTLQLRPGGTFHYCMRTPDGREMWGRFVYREITAPERIVFTSTFSDEAGGVTRNPWNADWPLEVLNEQTFAG